MLPSGTGTRNDDAVELAVKLGNDQANRLGRAGRRWG